MSEHEDLIDLLMDWELVEWFQRVFTDGPYMGELLFLSVLWAGLGIVMFIRTQSAVPPMILTIIFAGVIAASVGGAVANFILMALLVIIPGILIFLLWRGDR